MQTVFKSEPSDQHLAATSFISDSLYQTKNVNLSTMLFTGIDQTF
jgi:hypothetical protein